MFRMLTVASMRFPSTCHDQDYPTDELRSSIIKDFTGWSEGETVLGDRYDACADEGCDWRLDRGLVKVQLIKPEAATFSVLQRNIIRTGSEN